MRFSSIAFTAAVLSSLVSVPAVAADATFLDETSFQAAAGTTLMESFEVVASRLRANTAIVAPTLTVNPLNGAMIGIQDGSNTPGDGFGSYATQGSKYLLSYVDPVSGSLQSTGTLHFALNGPTRAFGLTITDLGEANGTVTLKTGGGAFSGGVNLISFPLQPSGTGQFFVGLTQDASFTDVYLTVSGLDEAYGVDRVLVTAVPEPAEYALLLAGLVLVGAASRRKLARA